MSAASVIEITHDERVWLTSDATVIVRASRPTIFVGDRLAPVIAVHGNQNRPRIVCGDESRPHLFTHDNVTPHVIVTGRSEPCLRVMAASRPVVEVGDHAQARIAAHDTAHPHVRIGTGAATPSYVYAFDESTPYVYLYGDSRTYLYANDDSRPRIVLNDAADPTIDVGDRSRPEIVCGPAWPRRHRLTVDGRTALDPAARPWGERTPLLWSHEQARAADWRIVEPATPPRPPDPTDDERRGQRSLF